MIQKGTHTFLGIRTSRPVQRGLRTVSVFVVISLLSFLLANDRPLAVQYKGYWLFPAFSAKHVATIDDKEALNYDMGRQWKTLPYTRALFAPCAWSANTIDSDNAPRVSPFDQQSFYGGPMPLRFRHWLGTTQNGNDVLSCLIHGAAISISIGIFSMLIASFIGITLGACAGYYQNREAKTNWLHLLVLIAGVLLAWFYGFETRSIALSEAFEAGGIIILWEVGLSVMAFLTLLWLFHRLGKWLGSIVFKENRLSLPVDSVVSKLIEVLNSIPALLFIIALSIIARPSYYTLILIIGALSWTQIARLTRAEYLRAASLDYVNACKAIGLTDTRILWRHILPNALPVILVQVVFGMAGAVMAEASLSFIGVGVPPDVMSWGALLNEAKDHFSSWWLVLGPGLCIFLLILAYHSIANNLTKKQ